MADPSSFRRRIRYEDVTIGWICALNTELLAARAIIDEEYDLPGQKPGDTNDYVVGLISRHNVVMTCLDSSDDPSSAANTAAQLSLSFPNIRCGLMVGIGGGVTCWEQDVRLGDVVVGHPKGISGGVVAFEVGKAMHGATEYRGHFNSAPEALRNAATTLDTDKGLKSFQGRATKIMQEASEKLVEPVLPPPDESYDVLLCSKAIHEDQHDASTCSLNCDPSTKRAVRPARPDRTPRIHRGLIASSHKVMADEKLRDQIVQELYDKFGYKILCFEMEAFTLVNKFPCLVVRGISDYADSQKSDLWQRYASLSAAAYAKELLITLRPFMADREESIFNQSLALSEADPEEGLHERVMSMFMIDGLRAAQDPSNLPTAKDSNHPFIGLSQDSLRLQELDATTDEPQSDTSVASQQAKASSNATKEHTQLTIVQASTGVESPTATREHLSVKIQNCLKQLEDDVIARNKNSRFSGWTLMHVAAESGNVEVFEYLRGRGEDPRALIDTGACIMHVAASGGHLRMVDHLRSLRQVYLGAENTKLDQFSIGARDKDGATAIHHAAWGGHIAMIDHLQELGQDVGAENELGQTAMHYAAWGGHIAMVDHLSGLGLDVGTKGMHGLTAMHYAAYRGHIAIVDHLSELGLDVGTKDMHGLTAMHHAAYGGHIAMVDHLSELGLDVGATTISGTTAMHYAAYGGHIAMVGQLSELGLDVGATSNLGTTAMHFAAKRGHMAMMKHLQELGLSVKQKNRFNESPRAWAARQPNVFMEFLRDLEREEE